MLSLPRIALAAASLNILSGANGLNILLGNDDGFGSGNLRELYRMVTEAGHNGQKRDL